MPRFLHVVVVALLILGAVAVWRTAESGARAKAFVAFDRFGSGCVIVVPKRSIAEEREAAKLIAETLALSAETSARHFPIVEESDLMASARRVIHVGRTHLAASLRPLAGSQIERTVGFSIDADCVVVRSFHRGDIGAAASAFLEDAVGARWFMPGESGVEVRRQRALALAPREVIDIPGYSSRLLGGTGNGPGGSSWTRANRLMSWLSSGHTAAEFTTEQVLAAHPDFAPVINGARVKWSARSVGLWQPNLLAPAFADFVAQEINRRFAASPDLPAVQFGLNDANRFDQSTATLHAVSPVQYFRGRPNYSELFYRFLNGVAVGVAREHPDRFVTTYAYYWTENTPSLRVASNVVPYLTADRTMWIDPEFAREDRALIARWGHAGPNFIALYDYLYGAPFFVPRPALWAIAEPISYAWEQGARAYYAEMTPNWALDGPKPWLAAQLLWNPQLNPQTLLDEYYARFWKEAAVPMRAFYELCDEQWRNQPRPLRWVKYLKDEDQRRLFSSEVRQRLRALLSEAATDAGSAIVRDRVRFVSDAFAVSDAFCEHDEVREEVNRLVFSGVASGEALRAAFADYTAARESLIAQLKSLKARAPLAIQSDLEVYLRNDPRPKIAAALAAQGALAQVEPRFTASLFEGAAPTEAELTAPGRERLVDSQLRNVAIAPSHPFAFTDWGRPAWQGRTEPAETRELSLLANADGSKRVRYVGCMNESLSQWVSATPGLIYRTTVRLKGRVSSGSMVMLSLSCLDAKGERVGQIHVDRLPVGEWNDGVTLEIIVRAPAKTAWVGMSPGVYNQAPGDWLELDQLSLREVDSSLFH